ncbi:MAG TPA: hypothetical protein DEB37_09840 [Lysinibacillus sp.]|nr:hypothetical protein [Lysinibacillus sp.]
MLGWACAINLICFIPLILSEPRKNFLARSRFTTSFIHLPKQLQCLIESCFHCYNKKEEKLIISPPFIVLKSKTIHRIYVKGEKGFPLQATCFPVGGRRAASSA